MRGYFIGGRRRMIPTDYTPGTILVNPFNKETFIFTQPESTDLAGFEVRLGPVG